MHTPEMRAPWTAVFVKEGHYRICGPDPRFLPICEIDCSRDGHEPTRTVDAPARANLIATAPELLHVLKECMEVACAETCDHINPTTIHTHECLRARAVIAKAETI